MVTPTQISTYTNQRLKKIIDISLINLKSLTTAPRVEISSVADTTNVSSVSIFMHLGRIVATAFTAGVNFRIEASHRLSGDDQWHTITTFTSALGSSVAATTASVATSLAGQNVITVASTTGFAVGNYIYIENATIGNSEWARVTIVTGGVNGTLTLEDNLTYDQQVGAIVTNQAEQYYALIDTTTFTRLRVVIDGSGAGQNFDSVAAMTIGA